MYGLATPEDFVLPPHHTLWTEESYKAFEAAAENSEKYDTKVGNHPHTGAAHTHTYTHTHSQSSASHEEIKPIPEPDIAPGKIPQPQTKSGCVIS